MNELYFISVLRTALEQSDPTRALVLALHRIRELGTRPEFSRGYEYFRVLMSLVEQLRNERPSEVFPTGETMKPWENSVGWRDGKTVPEAWAEREMHADGLSLRGERWTDIPGTGEAGARLEVHLWKDGHRVATVDIATASSRRLTGLRPGHFTLTLASGRVLWEEDLEPKDLFWAAAFPGKPVLAAADTGDELPGGIAQEHRLFDGEFVIRVWPSIESGEMELRYRAADIQ